jgi:hypothetical protein
LGVLGFTPTLGQSGVAIDKQGIERGNRGAARHNIGKVERMEKSLRKANK